MCTFDINYVTQNSSDVQMLAMLLVFQPLLRGLRQTPTEPFTKPAVVSDFCGAKMLALYYQTLTGYCKES